MTNAEADRRIARLMAHLERPGKTRDRQARTELARLRSWKRGEGMKLDQADRVLRDYYTDVKIKDLAYGENPFFAVIKKEPGHVSYYVQPIERKP